MRGKTRAAINHLRHGAIAAKVLNRVRRASGRPPRLLPVPGKGDRNHSSRRINAVLRSRGGRTAYLEVGVQYGRTLEDVASHVRWAVDPMPLFDPAAVPDGVTLFTATSDEFFHELDEATRFDVIFLDGLHEFRQTYRDIVNASAHLSPGGLIVVDDVVPRDRFAAISDQSEALAARRRAGLKDAHWQGDVYKAVAALHRYHPEVGLRTVVGSGNAQSFLRLPADARAMDPVDDEALKIFDTWEFEDAFVDGIPPIFHPTDEARALRWATSTVSV